jgi:hypothetical protein
LAGRPRGCHVAQDDAPVAWESESRGQHRRHGLGVDTDHAAPHAAGRAQLLEHVADDVARRRETDAFAATRLRQDERVDADDRPVGVDQRAAAVARIDRCVRLHVDHRVIGFDLPRHRAHDAERDAAFQAEGTAEGEYELPLRERLGIAETQRRQALAFDFEHREIGLAIDADELRTHDLATRLDDGGRLRDAMLGRELHLDRARPRTTCALVTM